MSSMRSEFCSMEFDSRRFDSIGFLLVRCLGLWLSCESVMIGMLSFLVSSFIAWENSLIFCWCDSTCLLFVISCR